MRELFENYNEKVNSNYHAKGGHISEVVVAYTALAKGMGKEDIAVDMVSKLPPSSSLNNPDYRLDGVIAVYAPEMVNEQSINMTR